MNSTEFNPINFPIWLEGQSLVVRIILGQMLLLQNCMFNVFHW